MKKAFITGITGQAGAYLTKLLLDKGYEVHGLVRKASTFNTERIDYLFEDKEIGYKKLFLHFGDMTDSSNLYRLIKEIKPDEIYNLAAQSHVHVSFEMPEYTADVDGIGVLRLLNAVKDSGVNCKVLQCSTSEMFGGIPGTEPQNELTQFCPKSPYSASKVFAYHITKNYRESYNMFVSNGIFFNYESPLRLPTFITRKITKGVAEIYHKKRDFIPVGNLDAKRDWGHAKDYVLAMHMILQHDKPDDFVVSTGKTHTVREFIEKAFQFVDISVEWTGNGKHEIGFCSKTGKILVQVQDRFFRPAEVEILQGDSTKIREILGWKPTVSFDELIAEMVEEDLTNLEIIWK
jgi:GDPmannose 4,6-dehydratase